MISGEKFWGSSSSFLNTALDFGIKIRDEVVGRGVGISWRGRGLRIVLRSRNESGISNCRGLDRSLRIFLQYIYKRGDKKNIREILQF